MGKVIATKTEKKGLSGMALKTLAAAAMLADTLGWTIAGVDTPLGAVLHFFGRMAVPIVFYLLVEGYHHTRNVNRYTVQIAVFALVSWVPYFLFEFGSMPNIWHFAPFGMGYTLLLGLLALRTKNEMDIAMVRWLVYAVLVFLSIWGDWAIIGLLMIMMFDQFRGRRVAQFVSVGILVAISALPILGGWWYTLAQCGQLAAFVPLWFYSGERGGAPPAVKWVFYALYPLHFIAFALLRWFL